MLFSEPKIPQHQRCASEAGERRVSVLFSEPKIPQPTRAPPSRSTRDVSVLFSEPKIPQQRLRRLLNDAPRGFQCSSASRKFLNQSHLMHHYAPVLFQCSSASRKFLNPMSGYSTKRPTGFQCSSASRKFLNRCCADAAAVRGCGFSALQRAENSSTTGIEPSPRILMPCFSALQRAENSSTPRAPPAAGEVVSFSALQRAENSSTWVERCVLYRTEDVSVLFSEPKIPQRCIRCPRSARANEVSVLFSEPKIPQHRAGRGSAGLNKFQCSSASRKFLNLLP